MAGKSTAHTNTPILTNAEGTGTEHSKMHIHRGMTDAELDSVLKDKERILTAEEIDTLLAIISGEEALAQARKTAERNPLFTLPDFGNAPSQPQQELWRTRIMHGKEIGKNRLYQNPSENASSIEQV